MDPVVLYKMVNVLSAAFCMAFGAAFAALGQGRAITAALEGTARQPEATNEIRTSMIIGLALLESLAIYCLVISLILLFVKWA